MSSASAVSSPKITLSMDHTPVRASKLLGQWARRAWVYKDSSDMGEAVFINQIFSRTSIEIINNNGRSNLLNCNNTRMPSRCLKLAPISIQDNSMGFLWNRVSLIEDDKVATACRDAIKRLTKCFAQEKRNEDRSLLAWLPYVKKYNPPSLPDSLPLKALEDWCEKNCTEATADVQVLRKAFGDFEITKTNYIPFVAYTLRDMTNDFNEFACDAGYDSDDSSPGF